jgi:wobble nucleotide-excising tRNase
MIESITIKDVASYGSDAAALNDLKDCNYIFGPNGSGKTTIGRIINNPSQFASCTVSWKGGMPLLPFVYNQDFINANYQASDGLPGVFTLGENNIEIQQQIDSKKIEQNSIRNRINQLKESLEEKKANLSKLNSDSQEAFWKVYAANGDDFSDAFLGLKNNKQKMFDRAVQAFGNTTADVFTKQQLIERAATVYGPAKAPQTLLPLFAAPAKIADDDKHLLASIVVGRNDIDIAGLITSLNNSDWVREGRGFHQNNICPFCQQRTNAKLKESLDAYFDENYTKKLSRLDQLKQIATKEIESFNDTASKIKGATHQVKNRELLLSEMERFRLSLDENLRLINLKISEPSQSISTKSNEEIFTSLKSLIVEENVRIETHNQLASNHKGESQKLTNAVWRHLANVEAHALLQNHIDQSKNLSSGIAGIESKIKEELNKEMILSKEIKDLEKTTTSLEPAKNEINAILASFGFSGFSISLDDSEKHYRLIRSSGEDAKDTLSEGEKSFVTFLYFYHLIKGSHSESGTVQDRVVVIDDPVSSLDSEVLFVVASLIRELAQQTEKKPNSNPIRQIIILTHNLYFFKEVSFERNQGKSRAGYWTVRKPNAISQIAAHKTNPVKSSYQLLWNEVAKNDRLNHLVQNVMRRIIEHYFTYLGSSKMDDLPLKFDGVDRIMCKSLLGWANDGSHSIEDDLHLSSEDEKAEAYLRIFKQIFEKTNNLAHYEMMMNSVAA